jgi:hypothetical protein
MAAASNPATSTQASKDGAEANEQARQDRVENEKRPPDQQVIGLSKHLTSWRDSYGDDVVDAAVEMSAQQRKVTAADKADMEKAEAAHARAAGGQSSSSAPAGRSASDPKSTATASQPPADGRRS